MLRWPFLLLLALTAACDPCAGIGACVAPQVRYVGSVTTLFPDIPAREVRVEFVRRGGVEMEEGVLTAVSDSAGRFVLEGRAREEGTVTGDLTFHPPTPIRPVTITGVQMETARAAGEIRRLGTWSVEYPFFSYRGLLFHRNNGQPPAKGIEVEFRRTGGIPIEPDTFTVRTDEGGFFSLRPRTTVVGEVVGDLVVRLLPPFQPYVVRGIRLSTFTIPRNDSIIQVGVGFGLPYSVLLSWSTGGPAAGIPIEVRRKGGIRVHQEVYRTATDAHGTVLLNPVPLERGELIADVVAILPAPRGEHVILRDLRLRTLEEDPRIWFLGFFSVPGGPDA